MLEAVKIQTLTSTTNFLDALNAFVTYGYHMQKRITILIYVIIYASLIV